MEDEIINVIKTYMSGFLGGDEPIEDLWAYRTYDLLLEECDYLQEWFLQMSLDKIFNGKQRLYPQESYNNDTYLFLRELNKLPHSHIKAVFI